MDELVSSSRLPPHKTEQESEFTDPFGLSREFRLRLLQKHLNFDQMQAEREGNVPKYIHLSTTSS